MLICDMLVPAKQIQAWRKKMPGTRTAPATTALDVTENQVSLGLVDASGDSWSENLASPGGAILDNAVIQAFSVAYQAATNASLWRVEQKIIWEGSKNPTNAVAAFRSHIENGINIGFQDTDIFNSEVTQRLVSPVDATMVGNLDIPVYPLVVPLSTLVAAYITVLGAGYSLEFLQFTGRRERRNNSKILA